MDTMETFKELGVKDEEPTEVYDLYYWSYNQCLHSKGISN
jgi:hypothetical protein